MLRSHLAGCVHTSRQRGYRVASQHRGATLVARPSGA